MSADLFPTREAIASNQLRQLRQLIQNLSTNAFYATKLESTGVERSIRTLEDFTHFPFTTKAELINDQRRNPPFGTNLTFPLDRYARYHQTSGTTGTPLRWLDTSESWGWMTQRWLEIFRAASVSAADRIVFAFSFGPFIGFWLAFEAGTQLGALCLPAGGLSSFGRLRLLIDAGATVLCCTPTYALRLAEVAQEEKIDLSKATIRRIIVAGEAGGSIPSTRARLEALWPGARVFDHHGMTETGPVSYECPARPGILHVMESGFIAEVIDPATEQAMAPGQAGELVLTNLGRTGSPLLRYRTGDLVQPELAELSGAPASTACACGRFDLALKGGILGRVDDMIIVRGVNVYPSAVEHLLHACRGVAEYQVKVTRTGALTELALIIEPDAACTDLEALTKRVKNTFHETLALRVPVELAPVGSLPRSEMKSRRWTMDKRDG